MDKWDVDAFLALHVRQALKAARLKAGLMQSEVARRIGVERQAVHDTENKDHLPRLTTIYRYCKAIGCEVADILPVMEIVEDGAEWVRKQRLEAADRRLKRRMRTRR